MSDIDDEDDPGFFRRHRTLITVAVVGLIGGGVALKMHKPSAPHAAPERIVMIAPIPPPPPKPIPTPPPVQQPEQKVPDQKQTIDPEPKAEAPKPEPKAEPEPSMGSNIKGPGDGFGLSGSGNGGFVGIGGNGSGGRGNPYARYATRIQSNITTALKNDKRTSKSAYNATFRLWLSSSGTVTRVEPSDSDAAAVLMNAKLLDEVPQGMPMPISSQINSTRPPR